MSDKTPYTINRKLQNIMETSVGEKKNLPMKRMLKQ